MKIYLLSSILFLAGVLHIINPGSFLRAMPDYIPFHIEVIYFTGILEIVFAIGLLFRRVRSTFSVFIALYFIAILPAHFHVSINQIEMFGIQSPILLWGRTIFQVVFIYWAYSCGKVKKED